MSENLDPMGDLAKAFNNISPSLEEEVKRLKKANKKLQTTLNETQRNLEQLKKNVNSVWFRPRAKWSRSLEFRERTGS